MKTLRIIATTALIAILACTFALQPGGVSASTGLHTGRHALVTSPYTGDSFNIDAFNYYCTGGGTSCAANAAYDNSYVEYDCASGGVACPGLNYAEAYSRGPYNGETAGTPVQVYVECDKYNQNGYQEIYTDDVYVSGQTYFTYEDLGAISGKSTLFTATDPSLTGSEDNTSQVSSQNWSVYDPAEHYTASVAGTQNTDNGPDTLNSGQFTITITGMIQNYDNYGVSSGAPYHGTLSCLAGGPHAYDLANAGLSFETGFEGELEPHVTD